MIRRAFLKAVVATSITPSLGLANPEDFWLRDRILWLQRKSNGKIIDEVRVVFWSNGILDRDNYVRCCYLLRDAEETSVVMMDPMLLDLMYIQQVSCDRVSGREHPIIINSGYRTREHNMRLEGAVIGSQHEKGKAYDGNHRGVSTSKYAEITRSFKFGGVGEYPTFCHTDVGRHRIWRG